MAFAAFQQAHAPIHKTVGRENTATLQLLQLCALIKWQLAVPVSWTLTVSITPDATPFKGLATQANVCNTPVWQLELPCNLAPELPQPLPRTTYALAATAMSHLLGSTLAQELLRIPRLFLIAAAPCRPPASPQQTRLPLLPSHLAANVA